jgi:hypothetical protein
MNCLLPYRIQMLEFTVGEHPHALQHGIASPAQRDCRHSSAPRLKTRSSIGASSERFRLERFWEQGPFRWKSHPLTVIILSGTKAMKR